MLQHILKLYKTYNNINININMNNVMAVIVVSGLLRITRMMYSMYIHKLQLFQATMSLLPVQTQHCLLYL